jgi:hypothetical protein
MIAVQLMAQTKSQQIMIPRGLFKEFHKGFSFIKKRELSPAQGFHELHDAVCEAFTRIDLSDDERENINDLINSLQNMHESLAEQEAVSSDADGYFVESEDLHHLVDNMRGLGDAIRMHQTELAHHDVAKALLWSKTALKKLIAKA